MAAEHLDIGGQADYCDLEEAQGLMDLMLEASAMHDRSLRLRSVHIIEDLTGPEYIRDALWAAAQHRGPRVCTDVDERVSVFVCGDGDAELTAAEMAEIGAAVEEVRMEEHLRQFAYAKLPSMRPREFLQALRGVGCSIESGSRHAIVRNPVTGKWTTIGIHGRTLRRAMINDYAAQLGLTPEQRSRLA